MLDIMLYDVHLFDVVRDDGEILAVLEAVLDGAGVS